jgi:small subunit ribosomal protein S16
MFVTNFKEDLVVKIRLRRVGATKQPSYRLVATDSRSPRDGRFLETIGTYNPLTEPATIHVDAEKAQKWLRQGAQLTPKAAQILQKAGIGVERTKSTPAPEA